MTELFEYHWKGQINFVKTTKITLEILRKFFCFFGSKSSWNILLLKNCYLGVLKDLEH